VFPDLLPAQGRLVTRAGVLTVFLAFVAFAVYPHGERGGPRSSDEWPGTLRMNARTAAIFSRSCADCHSNGTRWPWYSYVPPVSWLVKEDVARARKDFDASSWSSYSLETKRELLEDIARVVSNREMPLQQYLLLHRNARLSDTDAASLLEWAGGQRRMLRKLDGQH